MYFACSNRKQGLKLFWTTIAKAYGEKPWKTLKFFLLINLEPSSTCTASRISLVYQQHIWQCRCIPLPPAFRARWQSLSFFQSPWLARSQRSECDLVSLPWQPQQLKSLLHQECLHSRSHRHSMILLVDLSWKAGFVDKWIVGMFEKHRSTLRSSVFKVIMEAL